MVDLGQKTEFAQMISGSILTGKAHPQMYIMI